MEVETLNAEITEGRDNEVEYDGLNGELTKTGDTRWKWRL